MTDVSRSAKRAFSDLFGEIGAAWGLPQDACRVHALLYVNTAGTPRSDIGPCLDLTDEAVAAALGFLQQYELAWCRREDIYNAHSDPWDALMKGLDKRRSLDLPVMRKSLESCLPGLGAEGRKEAEQISKMIRLVDDLTAVHAQTARVSPQILRGVFGLTGRAARFFQRSNP